MRLRGTRAHHHQGTQNIFTHISSKRLLRQESPAYTASSSQANPDHQLKPTVHLRKWQSMWWSSNALTFQTYDYPFQNMPGPAWETHKGRHTQTISWKLWRPCLPGTPSSLWSKAWCLTCTNANTLPVSPSIIKKVEELTFWCSNEVIKEAPKKTRICIDPSQTVSKGILRPVYQMSTLSEQLHKLSEKVFYMYPLRKNLHWWWQCKGPVVDTDGSASHLVYQAPQGISKAPHVSCGRPWWSIMHKSWLTCLWRRNNLPRSWERSWPPSCHAHGTLLKNEHTIKPEQTTVTDKECKQT